MKALVLAGGTGSRLRPFTHTRAKQLLPLANRPVLHHALQAIAEAGIEHVGVVVGEHGDAIRRSVGDGSAFGLRVAYLHQPASLGLAHAVAIARDFLADDDFLLYLGDNYLEDGVAGFVRRAAADRDTARLLLTPVPDPTAFGVAEIDGAGRVHRLEEKPEHPRSDLAMVGVYAFTPAVHDAVRAIRPSGRGELEITHAVQWMVDQGLAVRAETTTRPWRDTGSVDDLLEANRHVLDRMTGSVDGKVDPDSVLVGRVRIAGGAVVTGSRIVGPVVIGPGAVISNSTVGPYTSVAEDCRIEDSAVGFSVLLRGACLDGAHGIERSLIGSEAVVAAVPRPHRGHRLVIGDHSKVQLTS
ncbi:glucose-1-phosphate thymidylyltransferase [Streptomyces monomycini]|uniref:glucose-1-phosphate thymidylyltransferase n=1 Tax=Streptomyces monomycini TaxID=371720 RepID=UPI0004AB74BF|nr:glucose-1-phosphate thymidylyltransferase [Streptomyces monomycini]